MTWYYTPGDFIFAKIREDKRPITEIFATEEDLDWLTESWWDEFRQYDDSPDAKDEFEKQMRAWYEIAQEEEEEEE